MMSWICDRCKKPDPSLKAGESASITLNLIITSCLIRPEEKRLTDSWEMCTDCYHDMKKAWDLKPTDVVTTTQAMSAPND